MNKFDGLSEVARSWLMKIFRLSVAAGPAICAMGVSDKVFASQFLEKGAEMTFPQMTYDPGLQMMVNPVTRQPIYENNKDMKLAKVTDYNGCSDCPKYDE